MPDIDLGFAEEADTAWLTNRYFPSKIGGKPAWLELDALPKSGQLLCTKCEAPKTFLCQIYSPGDREDTFHRTIYVFVCRTESCQVANSAENFTVLRSQLPLKNAFYSQDPPDEEGDPLLPIASPNVKLCSACGCMGPLSCGRCKRVSYCSAKHQRAHWPKHKLVCTALDSGTVSAAVPDISVPIPEIVFPEYEITIQMVNTDEQDVEKDDVEKEMQRLEEYEKLKAEGRTGELKGVADSELEQYAKASDEIDDKVFRSFTKKISSSPDQILRYSRAGNPLWIADVPTTLGVIEIPNCERCGANREFEFQIMPQMLTLLKDDHIDWGVLAVYTCTRSCSPSNGIAYMPEFILKQDIISEKK